MNRKWIRISLLFFFFLLFVPELLLSKQPSSKMRPLNAIRKTKKKRTEKEVEADKIGNSNYQTLELNFLCTGPPVLPRLRWNKKHKARKKRRKKNIKKEERTSRRNYIDISGNDSLEPMKKPCLCVIMPTEMSTNEGPYHTIPTMPTSPLRI